MIIRVVILLLQQRYSSNFPIHNLRVDPIFILCQFLER